MQDKAKAEAELKDKERTKRPNTAPLTEKRQDKGQRTTTSKTGNRKYTPPAAKRKGRGGSINKTRRYKQPVDKTGLVKKRKTIRFRDNIRV